MIHSTPDSLVNLSSNKLFYLKLRIKNQSYLIFPWVYHDSYLDLAPDILRIFVGCGTQFNESFMLLLYIVDASQ